MFIGHYAVAFAAKKATPNVSLGLLFLSAQFVDLLWPLLLLLGFEHVRIDPGNTVLTPLDFYDYPFSHSLVAAIVWSLIFGTLYYGFRHNKKESAVLGICLFSHWALDFITHRPDLPLAFGNDVFFGLGLWNSPLFSMIIELFLFVLGIILYITTTRSQDRIGDYGFWTLVSFLLLIYIGNFIGPPPPDEFAIAVVGNAAWLFVFWAYWVDRHRIIIS